MPERIAIIGDGAMATLCAVLLHHNGCRVRLWSAFPDYAEQLARTRVNRRYFPEVRIPEEVEIACEDATALREADWAVSAVPTQFIRRVWRRLAGACPREMPICSVAKGIENRTLLRPTQVLQDVLDGGRPGRGLVSLSGPSIAPEVARGLPATVTAASEDVDLAERVQRAFTRPNFRVYTNPDLVGVELAGATKNVIAIAAGILDGLSAGCNAKAALITRGLAEIARLGQAMGARPETFPGLSGMGDLITTCFSPIGRNRSFGQAVGSGQSVQDALAATESVVEGVATTESVVELARRHDVQMPITAAVQAVLFDNVPPDKAIEDLMTRPLKAEV